MNNTKIYSDIEARTNGDVYIGVVGPVRVGKSTFIKKFMETLVLPEIENEGERKRAQDEMPQSAAGATVMTTEPKFIPENSVKIKVGDSVSLNVKMIDCVGYIVEGAEGLTENGEKRMVMTPWSSTPLPFEAAAEIGTRKVIDEHATIGVMVTGDASFGSLSKEALKESERRVIADLKASKKPFVIVLNSARPDSDESIEEALNMEREYSAPVALVNCTEMGVEDIEHILELCLFEFPVTELRVKTPDWLTALDGGDELKSAVKDAMYQCAASVTSVASLHQAVEALTESEAITGARVVSTDLGSGRSTIEVSVDENAFYKALGKASGYEISGKKDLFSVIKRLGESGRRYERIKEALDSAEETGYGIVVPGIDDLVLEEPEIIKQSGGYGVKLKACADSIHMIKAKIKTEINPIVGSEKQSEEMVKFLLNEFRENPRALWESNMFGKSLYCLVNEGLNSKLEHMPADARSKIGETLQKIVNEGSNGLICIIL